MRCTTGVSSPIKAGRKRRLRDGTGRVARARAIGSPPSRRRPCRPPASRGDRPARPARGGTGICINVFFRPAPPRPAGRPAAHFLHASGRRRDVVRGGSLVAYGCRWPRADLSRGLNPHCCLAVMDDTVTHCHSLSRTARGSSCRRLRLLANKEKNDVAEWPKGRMANGGGSRRQAWLRPGAARDPLSGKGSVSPGPSRSHLGDHQDLHALKWSLLHYDHTPILCTPSS